MRLNYLILTLLIACGCALQSSRSMRPKTVAFALKLKGLTYEEVKQQMNSDAADTSRNAGIRYFFLSEESPHHPEPHAELYAFIFENDILIKIEKADKKGSN